MLFFAFIFPLMSFGQVEISDPEQRLNWLPGIKNGSPFSTAFACDQPTSFFVKTGTCKVVCEFAVCEEDCGWQSKIVEASFQPEKCSDSQLSIFSSLGHDILVTAQDYDSSSRSLALTIMKSIGWLYDGIEKIQVDQAMFPVPKNLIENGEMKPINLTVIAVSLFPDKLKNESTGLFISLDLNQTGLNQLICISSVGQCEKNSEYFFKRKGLVNAFN